MRRLFEKLACPILHLAEDIDNPISQAGLIGWLEDRKIREYDIEQRNALKMVSPDWPAAVSTYLVALNCPVVSWQPQNDGKIPANNRRALQWLASYALSLDFADNVEIQNEHNGKNNENNAMDDDEPAVSVSTDLQALLQLGEPLGLQLNPGESIAGN